MCGILGVIGNAIDSQATLALDLFTHRGLDGYGIATQETVFHTARFSEFKKKNSKTNKAFIGHALHAIVGNVAQPLVNKNATAYFAMNGEIYNWKALAKKYKLRVKNDAELLFTLLEKGVVTPRDESELVGAYAYVYWKNDTVFLSRDILGEKPICYVVNANGLLFASENKVLKYNGTLLDPKCFVEYNVKKNKILIKKKKLFFKTSPQHKITRKELVATLAKKVSTVMKEQTQGLEQFGILFSGGVDSTVLAYLAQKHKRKFICYSVAFEDGNIRKSPDLEQAKKIAKEYGFKLVSKRISLAQIEKDLPKIMQSIESTNPIKVGVALPFYYCAKLAKKDKIKVLFSGLGSEELFAGYNRHLNVLHEEGYRGVNKECLKGLYAIWQRDLYRDDLITMTHTIELRLPFLNHALVDFALRIPAKFKITNEMKKIVLRESALTLGLDKSFAYRPKLAAQYGSNFDKALEKLARKYKYKKKREYLNELGKQHQIPRETL